MAVPAAFMRYSWDSVSPMTYSMSLNRYWLRTVNSCVPSRSEAPLRVVTSITPACARDP